MTYGIGYLSVLQNLLEKYEKPREYEAVQQIEANTASLTLQVREHLEDGTTVLLGTISIAADEQLLYRSSSIAAHDFLRLKLARMEMLRHG